MISASSYNLAVAECRNQLSYRRICGGHRGIVGRRRTLIADHSNAPTQRTAALSRGQARRWRERRPELPADRAELFSRPRCGGRKPASYRANPRSKPGANPFFGSSAMEPTKAAVLISARLEQIRNERQSGRKPGAKLGDPVRLRISAGEYGRVRDHGQRRLRISLLENHALAGQAVEVRRKSCF